MVQWARNVRGVPTPQTIFFALRSAAKPLSLIECRVGNLADLCPGPSNIAGLGTCQSTFRLMKIRGFSGWLGAQRSVEREVFQLALRARVALTTGIRIVRSCEINRIATRAHPVFARD